METAVVTQVPIPHQQHASAGGQVPGHLTEESKGNMVTDDSTFVKWRV
tara:strand:- start:20 stop:163 length:144 start_codon:yes stop_codon:yes gene_type:complete